MEFEAARKSHNLAFSLAGNKVSDPSTISTKGIKMDTVQM